jgi:uncharacterized iron-regulated membrane protein
MIRTSTTRKLHRVLGVVVGIQVLIWTISGAVFVWNDIDRVRGDHARVQPEPFAILEGWVSPSGIDFGDRLDASRVVDVDLVRIGGETCYRFSDDAGNTALATVLEGRVRGPLTREEAVALASASFAPDAAVADAQVLTDDDVGPHHEYRSGRLPAWVIRFDHPSATRVYVTVDGGQVTSHRNRTWRVFDFFWMLHTMDYLGRDDFNHPLVRFVALAAIALGVSGYLLFSRTSGALRRRR